MKRYNKNRRNVVCYMDPLSLIRLGVFTIGSGTALRFILERHILFAKKCYICCGGAAQIKRQNKQRVDGVDPKVGIEATKNFINSDPNRTTEDKSLFLHTNNLYFF